MELVTHSPVSSSDSSLAIPAASGWKFWKKTSFRFFFIYFFLYMAPWTWLDDVPYISDVTGFFTRFYYQAMDWATSTANDHLFHIRNGLDNLNNGSGDRSYDYANMALCLMISLIGTLVWSILDRKRKQYHTLYYWLCVFTRFYVAKTAFVYGIIKLFALQMPFPSYTMLSTTLGDLLPMRFSWMFIGYSEPYQIFSGAME